MLKITGIELELTSDIEILRYLFIEKEIRGGISYIAKTFRKLNNKSMQFYDNCMPSKYIHI